MRLVSNQETYKTPIEIAGMKATSLLGFSILRAILIDYDNLFSN